MQLSQQELYELILETMSRSERKRTYVIMTGYCHISKEQNEKNVADFNEHVQGAHDIPEQYSAARELYTLLERKGLTADFIYLQWQTVRKERYAAKHVYDGKPQKQRRDNQNTHTGDGRSSGNSSSIVVRFPSKARGKSTWKRFWKLYPIYAGFYTLNEYNQACYKQFKEEALLRAQTVNE